VTRDDRAPRVLCHSGALRTGRHRSGLAALFEGFVDSVLDVVVVCNGYTDHMAGVTRTSGHPETVVRLQTASKPATREVDCRATAFPRIHLDANVRMPGVSAWAVLALLRSARRMRPSHRWFTTAPRPRRWSAATIRTTAGSPQTSGVHQLQGCVSRTSGRLQRHRTASAFGGHSAEVRTPRTEGD
jgi:hypothetical protein